jgi:hypothetical protein
MLAPRKGPVGLVVLALLLAPVLSGCGGSEPTAASTVAESGLAGGFVEQLKREDDETEVREDSENAPQTREEREELHEQAEQATMESAQGQESEAPAQAQGLEES